MATSKLFTVVGISTLNGQTKMRFATDVMRVKVLAKGGHQEITLIELPEPMLKVDAVKFAATLPEFQSDLAQQTVAEYLAKNDKQPKAKVERKPAKAAVTKKPAAKTKAPSKKAVDAAVAALEDAPF